MNDKLKKYFFITLKLDLFLFIEARSVHVLFLISYISKVLNIISLQTPPDT